MVLRTDATLEQVKSIRNLFDERDGFRVDYYGTSLFALSKATSTTP